MPASPLSAAFLLHKTCGNFLADSCLLFDLVFRPNTELQNVLKFFGKVMPAVVVAQFMGRQIVLFRMFATPAISLDMISVPPRSNFTPADVTPAISLSKYSRTLICRQSFPRRPPIGPSTRHHLFPLRA